MDEGGMGQGGMEQGGMGQGGRGMGPPVVAELAKIARVLREMESRQSFKQNPRGALQSAGVDMGMVPSSVVDMLSGMSEDELATVMRFHDALCEAGLKMDAPNDASGRPDGGAVCFF